VKKKADGGKKNFETTKYYIDRKNKKAYVKNSHEMNEKKRVSCHIRKRIRIFFKQVSFLNLSLAQIPTNYFKPLWLYKLIKGI